MFTEVATPINNLKDSFLVELIKGGMEEVIVEYKGVEYTIPWWENYHYYRGKVGDLEVFII